MTKEHIYIAIDLSMPPWNVRNEVWIHLLQISW